jgi:Mrp family chromosome partitioning ATPase/capsular polysaccharide biosynthesis protein
MEPISRPPRYVTLRDYLRVLRRYSIAIILVAAVGAGAGLADAKRHASVYQATATVTFQDPAQNLTLVGLGTGLIQTPYQLASQNSETLTRPQIMSRVRSNLRTRDSVRSLASSVSGTVTTAGLLQITASSSSPVFAARLATSVAAVVAGQANRTARSAFATAAGDVRHQIADLQRGAKAANISSTQLPVLEDELARLETLSNFAHSAQVAQNAQPPTSPSSPKVLRSAVIGLVLGLALGVLLAFLRDAMDRRLRTAHDIEASFQFPILGHVRKRALGKVVQKEAIGDDGYQADLEAFRILRRNIEFLNLDSPPRSVVVTSAVPEEGKTTVAASLAFAMASAGKRTLLIDADLRRPDLAARLQVERTPGLTDFLNGESPSTEIARSIQLAEPPSQNGQGPADEGTGSDAFSLTFVPAGSATAHAAELLGSRRFKQFIEQAAAAYDVVVIDSSPLLPVADTLEMLPFVDAVVVCARQAKTRREEALAARTTLERFRNRPVGVVVTGIKPSRHEYEVYSYSYSYH